MVALAVLQDRVLCRQGNAAHDDDYHDEGVEEGEGDDAMNKDPDATQRNNVLLSLSFHYIDRTHGLDEDRMNMDE